MLRGNNYRVNWYLQKLHIYTIIKYTFNISVYFWYNSLTFCSILIKCISFQSNQKEFTKILLIKIIFNIFFLISHEENKIARIKLLLCGTNYNISSNPYKFGIKDFSLFNAVHIEKEILPTLPFACFEISQIFLQKITYVWPLMEKTSPNNSIWNTFQMPVGLVWYILSSQGKILYFRIQESFLLRFFDCWKNLGPNILHYIR